MLHESLCVCVCLGALLAVVSAYPSQVAEAACRDMTPKGPGHNEAKPQRTPMPKEYIFNVDTTKIRPGGSVTITIEATENARFVGMMLQCRARNSDTPSGRLAPKSKNAKTIACSAEDDTGSHNDPAPKKRASFTWTANAKGRYDCFVTMAKTKDQFYVKHKMFTIDVV